MASGTKKHKCSCGRTFRHAISLKRHQNVTGCAPAEEAAAEAPEKVKAPATGKKKTAKRSTVAAAPAQEDDRTIVITPELVAAWQEQTGFNRRPVVDSIAPPPPKKQIDWVAVGNTTREFASFCGEVQQQAFKGAKSLLSLFARAALFCSVVLLSGWFLVTTVSASVTVDADEVAHRRIAARTLVEDFLQNAKLNHYQRARKLLAPGARESVTSQQLQVMLNSLPLHEQPSAWETQLASDGGSAKVVLHREGLQEVYTLVYGEYGWGLASVSVTNS